MERSEDRLRRADARGLGGPARGLRARALSLTLGRALPLAVAGLLFTGATVSVAVAATSPIQALAGCWANSLPADDDGSTDTAIPLGFTADFFGTQESGVYVNNNGNVTFDEPLSEYTPTDLTGDTGTRIIAPFFADVDTTGAGSALTTYGTTTVGSDPAFCVNWGGESGGVGYYDSHDDKLDRFQLLLIDRSDIAAGDFDIEFNYDQIQWETGDASGGVDGLGGQSAVVGYGDGTGTPGAAYQLPGSAVNGALIDGGPDALVTGSRDSSMPGRYVFEVRGGVPPLTPVSTSPPSIQGSPVVGQTLTEVAGTWVDGPLTYSYQWQDCDSDGSSCTPIAGATAQSYTVASADLGDTIEVAETAANADGDGLPAASSPTDPVTSAPILTAPATQAPPGATDAELGASLNPGGLDTTVSFAYGLDPKYTGATKVTYSSETEPQTVDGSAGPQEVADSLSGLVPNALYHVRLVASNADGRTYGPDATFKTAMAPPPPPPVLGQTLNLGPATGNVLIKPPGGSHWLRNGPFAPAFALVHAGFTTGAGYFPLTELSQVPVGSEIDARRGSLQVTNATGERHHLQKASFGGALFGITQHRRHHGETSVSLLQHAFAGAPSRKECRVAGTSADGHGHANRRKVLQRLNASTRAGNYQTVGRYSTASVQHAARWQIEDRCDGTMTRVTKGNVTVHDTVNHRTIVLHAHQSFLAKPS
jgi:Nidogen-like